MSAGLLSRSITRPIAFSLSLRLSPVIRPPAVQTLTPSLRNRRRRRRDGLMTAASASFSASATEEDEEWLKKLPDKKKPLYAHSLPCIEAWLRKLGFRQSQDERAVWLVEKTGWHAQLSLDVTDLYIRYLKNGPGNLEKDIERRFSYALSREDIENAILGGP
ncbi:uncharacterized protein LOC121985091 [Zingiber officinale]|uniref:Uncharacterized protein n=1 Tax=Zingiber officinale TaxID=94328 RepID=A0A8J5GGU0_ZINOF|nr:uncharacterized protein LOC121985091 [Zingiber officinale]KAG6504194.1 hypothetical protein ZIOFF_036525 [Zingiber officinale]